MNRKALKALVIKPGKIHGEDDTGILGSRQKEKKREKNSFTYAKAKITGLVCKNWETPEMPWCDLVGLPHGERGEDSTREANIDRRKCRLWEVGSGIISIYEEEGGNGPGNGKNAYRSMNWGRTEDARGKRKRTRAKEDQRAEQTGASSLFER